MRLIDGDAVYAKINKLRDADKLNGYELILLDTVLAAIKFSDTVDAVKHGRWIHIDALPSGDYFKCSECNRQIFLHFGWKVSAKSPADEYRYCSGCGAKMDGEA